MATSLPAATAAPRSLKVGGVTYQITPLTLDEWGEYIAWVQDETIATTKRNVKDLDVETRTAMIEKAIERANMITMESPEFAAINQRPTGMFRILWMHLRKRHPDLMPDDVVEIFCDPENLEEAMSQIEQTVESGEKPAKKKKRKSPARKVTRSARSRRRR